MNQQLSPDIYAQLEKLHDIHLPEPVSWWPLAIGWWVLIGISLCCVGLGIIYLLRQRYSFKATALNELKDLHQRYDASQLSKFALASELSVLLHRIVIHINGHEFGVKATEVWSDFLSDGEKGMSPEIAEYISQAPYRQYDEENTLTGMTLLNAAERWIRRHV